MNATPVYTLTIPSTGKEFKYRPFLVRDEKALLIAQQSEDPIVMLDSIKNVIESCAKSDVNVNTLSSFDVEYIFLNLRSVSIGEIIALRFKCDNDHGADNEKAYAEINVDLRTAKVVGLPTNGQKPNKIDLFGDVGVMMKYPTIDTIKKLDEAEGGDIDQAFDIVVDCIDYIYSADEVFLAKDQKREELIEFLNNLTSDQYQQIQRFFRTMPSLRIDIQYTCPVCGKVHNKYLEGLESFF